MGWIGWWVAWLNLLAGGAFAESPEIVRVEDGVTLSRLPANAGGFSAGAPALEASVELEAGLLDVLAVLADDPRRTEWMPRCVEAMRLPDTSQGERVLYSRTAGSWPVAGRDAVLAVRTRFHAEGRVAEIDFRTVESAAAPRRDGVVRMPRLVGRYRLEALGHARTRVHYRAVMDIGGSVPDVVLRWSEGDMPVEILRGLRRQVQRTLGSYEEVILQLEAEQAAALQRSSRHASPRKGAHG